MQRILSDLKSDKAFVLMSNNVNIVISDEIALNSITLMLPELKTEILRGLNPQQYLLYAVVMNHYNSL